MKKLVPLTLVSLLLSSCAYFQENDHLYSKSNEIKTKEKEISNLKLKLNNNEFIIDNLNKEILTLKKSNANEEAINNATYVDLYAEQIENKTFHKLHFYCNDKPKYLSFKFYVFNKKVGANGTLKYKLYWDKINTNYREAYFKEDENGSYIEVFKRESLELSLMSQFFKNIPKKIIVSDYNRNSSTFIFKVDYNKVKEDIYSITKKCF